MVLGLKWQRLGGGDDGEMGVLVWNSADTQSETEHAQPMGRWLEKNFHLSLAVLFRY